jgi:hypothetical protein
MTQPTQTKRRFSSEFKLETIEQVVKYQRSVVEVARTVNHYPPQFYLDNIIESVRVRAQYFLDCGTAGYGGISSIEPMVPGLVGALCVVCA